MKHLFAAISVTLFSGIAMAQGTPPATQDQAAPAASAPAAQAAPAPGAPGPRGRMMRFNGRNTPGWSLMTPEEQRAHREKMQSMKTMDECKAYRDQHRKQMEARAQERGLAPRPMRNDPCVMMQRRGLLTP